jgi:KUP system potassium uptake protein
VLVAVVSFGSSEKLGAAYGIAVTATKVAMTLLTFFVIHNDLRYGPCLSLLSTGVFLLIDGALFSGYSLRLHEGGWFPLVMGGIVMLVRRTWSRGREIVAAKLENHGVPMDRYLDALLRHPPVRIPGTAVFFRPRRDSAPAARASTAAASAPHRHSHSPRMAVSSSRHRTRSTTCRSSRAN